MIATTLERPHLMAKSRGASSRSRDGVRWRTLRGDAATKSWLRQRARPYRPSAARAKKKAVFCHRPRGGGQRTEDGERYRATVHLRAGLHAHGGTSTTRRASSTATEHCVANTPAPRDTRSERWKSDVADRITRRFCLPSRVAAEPVASATAPQALRGSRRNRQGR